MSRETTENKYNLVEKCPETEKRRRGFIKGHKMSAKRRQASMKKRLYALIAVCLLPLTAMMVYLLVLLNDVSQRYDSIVENITMANAYNIVFKENMDYLMYIIVVNEKRAQELIDVSKPLEMIDDARQAFHELYKAADTDSSRESLRRVLKSLDTLEDRVKEIEEAALVSGSYDANMNRLDLNIRVLTDLIQEQIQKYIYEQAIKMEELRIGIRKDVERSIFLLGVVVAGIFTSAFFVSGKVISSITKPIQKLCKVAKQAGQGDFKVRVEEAGTYELTVLKESFNHMIEELGQLVEDIRIEQLNLRAAELQLLQEQINPHFLYNTLDTIIWLAESHDTEHVVKMVTSLSDFFRTTLSKGKDFISVEEEKLHIESYLAIQQFRYQDIMEYEISFSDEILEYEMLKLTLQPLVENALYHGIKNKRGMGHIQVIGKKEGQNLVFRVRDDGIGMTAERLLEVQGLIQGDRPRDQEYSGFGLFNINQRIRLYYGQEYGLTLDSVHQKGTQMQVAIPCVKNQP